MPPPKGSKHTDEARRKMSESRTGKPHSEERKAKIAAANRGKTRPKVHQRTCACGNSFLAGVPNARYCSVTCKRAAKGHGLRHAPQFMHFPQECAICTASDDLVGDHEHSTGRARGILCRNCNLALGNMGDDPAKLRAAADYLEAFQQVKVSGVYLCGPMTGLPESNYPAFHRAARSLREHGHRVENPAENSPPPCGTWEGWMRLALEQLVRCERIALLPGWENSRGAKLEHHIATALGMKPIFLMTEAAAASAACMERT